MYDQLQGDTATGQYRVEQDGDRRELWLLEEHRRWHAEASGGMRAELATSGGPVGSEAGGDPVSERRGEAGIQDAGLRIRVPGDAAQGRHAEPALAGIRGEVPAVRRCAMPPNHRQYSQWNGDRFRRWAAKIGPNTGMVVSAILSGYKVEQQGYKSCLGLLKLADKYSPQRLEGACTRALTFTPRPSLKNIQAILASGQDRLPVEESAKADTSAQYGFTRGADYYGGRDK